MMTIEEIVTLIQAVSDNGLTSFEYTEGDQSLVLKKKKKKNISPASVAPVVISQPAAPIVSPVAVAPSSVAVPSGNLVSVSEKDVEQKKKEKDEIASDKVVVSPLVGTFYASANPEAEPFVKVGDPVKKGQVLGIIEAMKLMNEIESEYDGIVEAVLVENETVVEYGQPLFRIR